MPSRDAGDHERAKSRPTREIGPPAPSTAQKMASCHHGRGELAARRMTHARPVAPAEPSTIQLRRSGWRAVKIPARRPEIIAEIVRTTRSAEAPVGLWPCPATKNGTPHKSVMTFAEKGVRKWLQNPSRLPAVAAEARTAIHKRSGGEVPGRSRASGSRTQK